ncbi:MAG: phosphatidate cytidylyltransferase [Phyllobacteriaceae bacterium]|nr:phosphatidate cytidylyltransferase [Phyllobacteriaceae bacterium]
MVVTAVLAIGIAAGATISLRPSLQWIWRFLLFPALPFAAFTFAAKWFEVPIAFVLALLIVEIFDSFALLGGRLFGKRLLAPKLSPRKTWEGLLTGLAAVFLVSGGLASALDLSMATVAAISAVATAGAVVGDLTASAAKRRAGVKDYPALLAIQGGLLDIYDAWIVAAPLAAVLAVLLSSAP